MLTRELNHKIHLYKSRGGKASRRRSAQRMLEFVNWCNCEAHQTGKKHVHKFFEEKTLHHLPRVITGTQLKRFGSLWGVLENRPSHAA
ncbi:hypothetical protein P4M26_15805 [Pseudomonas aeruginosa]|nr:hypothetical protein [Pseudomonas aeruginosa]MDF5825934.1 hypothetical protein [Pseudomonas aeruginosa]MDF5882572.1 hypothetical protein [Pseudomonas aeruginosa]MDF5906654.1 hypothetical protein [Pseudomonas aeruginosa]MDF5990932.1 hypothetical protein [Pseudomonas aeruginosa]